MNQAKFAFFAFFLTNWPTHTLLRLSHQVVASYVKEECTLEACIQLPPEYPLRSVEVTCSRRMGVAESRWVSLDVGLALTI